MGGIGREYGYHLEGAGMTRIVLYFNEAEIKLLERARGTTGLSCHDMILRAVRAYDRRNKRN